MFQQLGLVVLVAIILIQQLVIFFVLHQVLVVHALFFVQISRQLILNINLVMLVLDEAQFFKSESRFRQNSVESFPREHYIFVVLDLFDVFDKRAQFFLGHGLNNWLDLRASLLYQLFHVSLNYFIGRFN